MVGAGKLYLITNTIVFEGLRCCMSDGDLKNIETSHSSLYYNLVLGFLLCDCVDVCSQNQRMIYFCLYGNTTYKAVLLQQTNWTDEALYS